MGQEFENLRAPEHPQRHLGLKSMPNALVEPHVESRDVKDGEEDLP